MCAHVFFRGRPDHAGDTRTNWACSYKADEQTQGLQCSVKRDAFVVDPNHDLLGSRAAVLLGADMHRFLDEECNERLPGQPRASRINKLVGGEYSIVDVVDVVQVKRPYFDLERN